MSKQAEVSFDDELLILVDEQGTVTGYDSKLNVHLGQGRLHRACSIFLFSPCGRVLLQQRSARKPLWPLYWSNSVCSHPRKGEQSDHAAMRRLCEELAVATPLEFLFEFRYSARYGDRGAEHELCSVFAGCIDVDYPVIANANEVADWKWVRIEELDRRLATEPQRFTPWLLLEWDHIRRDNYAVIESLHRDELPESAAPG